MRKIVTELAAHQGINDRVHFIHGGKLAKLLDHAKTASTTNSTAVQQALWRSIPLKTLGSSIYGQPEFVSDAPLSEFFVDPDQPDSEAYVLFREFLLLAISVARRILLSFREATALTVTDRKNAGKMILMIILLKHQSRVEKY